jgi:integrase
VDPDYTATVGLSREQGRALIAAADADSGRARLRSAAVIRLLLHNALRVDEALGADLADLGTDRGHQVLTVLGKGNRRAKVALTPATLTALHRYLDDRAAALGWRWREMSGPLLADLRRADAAEPAGELVRRLAAAAGISEWDRCPAHSLRHTGITMALDAGVLRDVQDYARHRDARTTRRYDHSATASTARRLRRRRVPADQAKPGGGTRRARTTLFRGLLHDDGLVRRSIAAWRSWWVGRE